MGLFRTSTRAYDRPGKRGSGGLLAFLLVVFLCVRLFSVPHSYHFGLPRFPLRHPVAPIIALPESGVMPGLRLGGVRIRGNGAWIDLGDRRTHLPGSLLSRFFPDELVVPSCLTQMPPAPPAEAAPQPVRDDWPGFYGAPWIGQASGNLIALLNVTAGRHAAGPVPPPRFEIYPDYNGSQSNPGYSTQAAASFQRGAKAVLYRVFVNGPVRCLDLVVLNGENTGIGHVYYSRYRRYYQSDIIFRIQP